MLNIIYKVYIVFLDILVSVLYRGSSLNKLREGKTDYFNMDIAVTKKMLITYHIRSKHV